MKHSLKQLKAQMNMLNDIIPNYLGKQFYITTFGRHYETNEVISIERHTGDYAQRSNANWCYQLVFGSNTGKR